MTNKRTFLSFVIVISLLIISSCAPQNLPTEPPAPTEDINLVRTQAAQTVVAQITAEALLNPSATIPAPTLPPATEAPTLTPLPALPTATSTKVVSSGGGGGGGGGAPAATATSYTDAAKLVDFWPPDGFKMSRGQDFDAKFTFKNTGKRTWTTDFYIRTNGGDMDPYYTDTVMVAEPVAVNDTYTFVVDYAAPYEPGIYRTYWKLVNDDAVTFYKFYIVIEVE
ncbi:MAG: hypothetical protein HPY76_13935 [Anaerolineae bacterium]|nr:hypothetical protein [Anaerolineae bacterium]